MNEDQSRSRLGNSPNNLAVLRHMALNIMQKDADKGSLRGKFKRAGWNNAYLTSNRGKTPGKLCKVRPGFAVTGQTR